MKNARGFTLVEMIVVMVIFMTVIMISASAFEKILGESGHLVKSSQAQIEEVVGLEILRRDLEHVGYGLPWSFQNPFTTPYTEVDVSTDTPVDGIDAESFNDTPPTIPRAVVVGSSATTGKIIDGSADTNPGVDYLVAKSIIVSMSPAAQRLAYVNYSGNELSNKSFIVTKNAQDDIVDGDRVISVATSFSSTMGDDRQLLMDGTNFFYVANGSTPPSDAFKPTGKEQRVDVYGVDHDTDLRMPYNRADYYIKRPATGMNPRCNAGTGILYKSVVEQGDYTGSTGYIDYPLLDCVGDMQVVFELDTSGIDYGGTMTYVDGLASLSAKDIREQLRTIRVYLLTHEGRKDTSFSYPVSNPNKVIVVGNPNVTSTGRVWKQSDMTTVFGADWRNYRWKVHEIAVKPRNLYQKQ